jgi:hypothetical protein
MSGNDKAVAQPTEIIGIFCDKKCQLLLGFYEGCLKSLFIFFITVSTENTLNINNHSVFIAPALN